MNKLVNKIARAMRTKQMHILGYPEFKDDPEDGTTEGLDLELAQVALQAILSDPNIVEISKGERGHILETQESLCRLGESVGDDGSCCICQSIKEKLEKK